MPVLNKIDPRAYFHHTEGRGNNCVVEPFRPGELDYFFAYPEDYLQQSIEWVDDRQHAKGGREHSLSSGRDIA